MITFFTTAKAFRGHFGLIQTNAIRSWTRLSPRCEVIIFGDDEGVAEISAELSIHNIRDIERSAGGMPLLNSMFEVAQDRASHNLICFINADIALLNDFTRVAGQVAQLQKGDFLMTGRRWDVDIDYLIDFDNANWEERLRERVKLGRLHSASGIDVFLFPRGTYRGIPPLAAARTGFDNWLIYRAREMNIPVIDATGAITIIHQDHDYSHFPGGADAILATPDVARNREMMGGDEHSFSLNKATLVFDGSRLRRPVSPKYLYNRFTASLVLNPRLKFFHRCYRALTRLVFRISALTGFSRLYRKLVQAN